MAYYKDNGDGVYKTISTNIAIPELWQEITAEEYVLLSPIVITTQTASCSAWQIRKALNAQSLREQVEAAVAAASIEVQDGWNHATIFESNDLFVIQFATLIGKDPHDFITYACTL
jgi:hypothetical protein